MPAAAARTGHINLTPVIPRSPLRRRADLVFRQRHLPLLVSWAAPDDPNTPAQNTPAPLGLPPPPGVSLPSPAWPRRRSGVRRNSRLGSGHPGQQVLADADRVGVGDLLDAWLVGDR